MMGELAFEPEPAHYVAANRAHLLAMWCRGRTWRTWLGMIALMSGIGAFLGYWLGGTDFVTEVATEYALLGIIIMPVVHLILFAVTIPIRIRRTFAQQKSATLMQEWRWSDAGLEIVNAQGSARHTWDDLFGWRIMRGVLLLYLNERVFHPLPMAAVAHEEWRSLTETVHASSLRRY